MSKVYLINDFINRKISGKDIDGKITVKISKNFEGWEFHLMDFICYEKQYGRTVSAFYKTEDYELAKAVYNGHSIRDNVLRSYESKVLVHSTTLDNWNSIQKSGILKSWNIARYEGDIKENVPIGDKLGDFEDYRDYIMLGTYGFWNERIVASKQKGKLCYDENEPYIPGVRIYLDAQKIAHDGILVRDGLHLKVKNRLLLKPYMIWTADAKNFNVKNEVWTPLSFSQISDRTFLKLYDKYK